MDKPKKLIEVAMPIKEISAESVRDKSIRHGHISTLHLWWARRPLPVCRAVVFASLVPDPLDENCPEAFRQAVKILLREHKGMDAYKPYDDIPYTTILDPVEDNLRNRLLMFIGKFSDTYIRDVKAGKKTAAKDMLSEASLIKWDNKNNEEILGKARKLIWVSHNADSRSNAADLLLDFDKHYQAIKEAEDKLYITPDRHLESDDVRRKESALHEAIEAFLDRMPKVFDPFAGGGAIPLEASRLGCRTFGNDINPVAHIIQKGSLEFPQKYGKPIVFSNDEFVARYGEETFRTIPNRNRIMYGGESLGIQIENRLSFDVEFFAKELLSRAEAEISYFYPSDDNVKKPLAYLWARVGTCSNPSCKAEVPVLKGFYLSNTSTKQFHLKPIIDGNTINFSIVRGAIEDEGWNHRGNLRCPCCGNTTDVRQMKQQSINGELGARMLAVVIDGQDGKEYRLPTRSEIEILKKIPNIDPPTEKMQRNSAGGDTFTWGFTEWGQVFSNRQLLAMQTLVAKLKEITQEIGVEDEFGKAIVTYLGILIDRIVIKQNTFITWDTSRETISNLFGKQAIPMIFDYVEGYPFSTSSGGAVNATDWITRYIESESHSAIAVTLINASSGDKEQFLEKFLDAVVTDPPYYDAMAYADLSDFFYVWLKRTLGDIFPANFATPQTPKSEECTALKHHHANDASRAKQHFEDKLRQIFDAIEHQTSGTVCIMFAHQSTEAWTTLCKAIIGARMNITGSWAMDTELTNRVLGLAGSVLASSVTVSCKPAIRNGFGDYRNIRLAINEKVENEVAELYALGFRGADLLTACFGKAVGEFGNYEKVEKADGSEVTVAELLKMTRESAFNALLKGFQGDDYTKFYIGWLELNGFAETDFDDAAQFTRVSMPFNVNDLFTHEIFVKNGNKQSLADFIYRNSRVKSLGEKLDSTLIDKVHKAMWLYKAGNRPLLLEFLSRMGAFAESPFWRVLTSLDELLPKGIVDQKQVAGLIENKDNLLRAAKAKGAMENEQPVLGFGEV